MLKRGVSEATITNPLRSSVRRTFGSLSSVRTSGPMPTPSKDVGVAGPAYAWASVSSGTRAYVPKDVVPVGTPDPGLDGDGDGVGEAAVAGAANTTARIRPSNDACRRGTMTLNP